MSASTDRIEVERFLATLESPRPAAPGGAPAGSGAGMPTVDLIRAWAPEQRAAELARNARTQATLERRASKALHVDVDIPSWGRLTRQQIALVVERVLNTELDDTRLGETVTLTNPLGRPLEYVRTPGGWERLRRLPDAPGLA